MDLARIWVKATKSVDVVNCPCEGTAMLFHALDYGSSVNFWNVEGFRVVPCSMLFEIERRNVLIEIVIIGEIIIECLNVLIDSRVREEKSLIGPQTLSEP